MTQARHTPMRSCVSCGLKLPKRQLLRIFRNTEGAVQVDPSGKGTGRGAYLCTSEPCWNLAVSKGNLERGLRSALTAADKEYLLGYYRQHQKESHNGILSGEKE